MAGANATKNKKQEISENEGKTIDTETLPDSGADAIESDQENVKSRLISVNDAIRTVLAA